MGAYECGGGLCGGGKGCRQNKPSAENSAEGEANGQWLKANS